MVDPLILEAIAARGWPAAETGALGGWRLHASAGRSGRVNTCWAHAAPDRAPEAAIDAVEAWYAARGLPPRFKLVDEIAAPSDLAERLRRRGYRPDTPTLTMTGPLAGAPDPDAEITAELAPGFRRIFADASFGDAADAAERLGALARTPPPRGFALIALAGAPAAIGTCVVEGDWAGIIGMRTAPAFRRQGLARRVFRALAHHAAGHGATRGYLQVEAGNAAAIALYESEGYEAAYLYRYWSRA
jgi:ribosomal protein S18 acetylase RimI-like enzyme